MSDKWYSPNIDRSIIKELKKRSDLPGWQHMITFFWLLLAFGIACYYTYGTWWFLLPYFAYCTLWGGSDAIWHECGHRTAFKSKRINDFFYNIASYMDNFEPVRWRWSHALHHSYTGSTNPHDFESDHQIFARPSLFGFLLMFVPGSAFLTIHKSLYVEIIQHALGVKTKVMLEAIPERERWKCVLSSRIFVAIWISIILWSYLTWSLLPILLFLVPKFFATLNIVWGITQHWGLPENVKDHRLSTRSVKLNPIFSFIYWKMEYHIEHHMFPVIPSYNLPKLHEHIKHELPKPLTLWQAYKEIIPAVIKKHKDPNFSIKQELPSQAL
tara:strand:- start:41 stop:1021 length:981 start_codon:yes stop_codon:yes gene_type:complete